MAKQQVTPPRREFDCSERRHMVAGLNFLARLDLDHAQFRNDQGFGKRTTAIGHYLAWGEDLYTEQEQADAWKILYAHRRQLPSDLLDGLGIPVPAARDLGKPRTKKATRGPGKYVAITEVLRWSMPFTERHFVEPFIDANLRRPRGHFEWRMWIEACMWERNVGVWVAEDAHHAARARAEASFLKAEADVAAHGAARAQRGMCLAVPDQPAPTIRKAPRREPGGLFFVADKAGAGGAR